MAAFEADDGPDRSQYAEWVGIQVRVSLLHGLAQCYLSGTEAGASQEMRAAVVRPVLACADTVLTWWRTLCVDAALLQHEEPSVYQVRTLWDAVLAHTASTVVFWSSFEMNPCCWFALLVQQFGRLTAEHAQLCLGPINTAHYDVSQTSRHSVHCDVIHMAIRVVHRQSFVLAPAVLCLLQHAPTVLRALSTASHFSRRLL